MQLLSYLSFLLSLKILATKNPFESLLAHKHQLII